MICPTGWTADKISSLVALMSIPWSIKPLFGLLTDFVPLFGSRRRSYLLVCTALSSAALATLFAASIQNTENLGLSTLAATLSVATLCIAFGDVVADAHMVEQGQRYNLIGRFQSVQWFFLMTASILTGFVGG